MKRPMQTINVIPSACSWLHCCPQATRLQLYICMLQLSKGRPRSPTFLQPCQPQGQPAVCLHSAGSRGLRGEPIPAPSLSHSSCCCFHHRELAASSWDSNHRQISNHPGLLSRAQLLLLAQSPAKSGIEMPGPFSHHCRSAVGRLLTSSLSPLRTLVLELVTKKGLCAVCSASLALPQDIMLCFLQLPSDEVVLGIYKQQVKLLQTLERKLRIREKTTTGVMFCVVISRRALESCHFSWFEHKICILCPHSCEDRLRNVNSKSSYIEIKCR